MSGEDWRELAACRGKTTRMFVSAFEPLALKTCESCPVRVPCQGEGERELEYGVWGGLTVPERRRVAQKRKNARYAA